MRLKLIFLLTAVMLAASLPVRAEVFSLLPFSTKDPASLTAISNSMDPKRFWTEKINVNGADMTMEIYLINRTIRDVAAQVRSSKSKNVSVFANSNSLLLQEVQKDGSLLRTYYLELSGVSPILEFKMVIPAKHCTLNAADWPSELPLIAGAKELTCMRFPVRNAVYGSFMLPNATMPQVLSDISDRITAKGWTAVSREAENVFKGSGEVFMKENPSSIMILGLAPSAKGKGVRVTVYTRKL